MNAAQRENKKAKILNDIRRIKEAREHVKREELLAVIFNMEEFFLEGTHETEDREEYVSVDEVAKLFGVTPQAVYKWIKNGKIQYKEKTPSGGYLIPKSQFQFPADDSFEKAHRALLGEATEIDYVDKTDIFREERN